MKATIGFASKYYTYWLVSKPYNTTVGSYQHTRVDYQYIQNLSFNEEKAKKRIVELSGDSDFQIDLELRGSKSFKRTVQTKYIGTGFAFGKYINKSFAEVDDNSYKLWYYFQTKGTDKHSDELELELLNKKLLVFWNGEYRNINDLEWLIRNYVVENLYKKGFHGTDGERVTLTLRFREERVVDTAYGGMVIANFIDENLNMYFYTGSKSMEMERGDKAKITARLKHNEFFSQRDGKYVKQTRLKRPKIELIEETQ